MLVDKFRELLEMERCTLDIKKKAQIDARVTYTLQYGLTNENPNRFRSFKYVKDLWEKLVELHEGTTNTKITKSNHYLYKLSNIKVQDNESSLEESGMEEPKKKGFMTLMAKEDIGVSEFESKSESSH